MDKKHNAFEKISNFIAGKGFYLVVLICVAAIALSGLYLYRSVNSSLDDLTDQTVSGTAPIISFSPDLEVTASPKVTIPAEPEETASTSPSPSPGVSVSPSPSPVVSPSPSPSPAALVFTWPLNGSIIADFSVEALAYDVTMGDWRTHSGLDIAAAAGTRVMAAASGTVSTIYEDDMLGTTVVIDHSSGLISVYSNLAEVPAVKIGQTVSTGTVIGSVGSTAAAESGLEPHLHFALFKNDKAVSPLDYLPEK